MIEEIFDISWNITFSISDFTFRLKNLFYRILPPEMQFREDRLQSRRKANCSSLSARTHTCKQTIFEIPNDRYSHVLSKIVLRNEKENWVDIFLERDNEQAHIFSWMSSTRATIASICSLSAIISTLRGLETEGPQGGLALFVAKNKLTFWPSVCDLLLWLSESSLKRNQEDFCENQLNTCWQSFSDSPPSCLGQQHSSSKSSDLSL